MLACDESTDTSDAAQLLIFLRGVDNEMNASEELLDLRSRMDHTKAKGTDLFAAVGDMKLQWNNITAVITDSAPAMVGEHSGLSTLVCNKVREEGGKAMKLHCIIYQQVVCDEHLKYDRAMKPVVKAITYIRSEALCHRQFLQILLNIRVEYGGIVYHTDGRWLSRGSALQRFYSL